MAPKYPKCHSFETDLKTVIDSWLEQWKRQFYIHANHYISAHIHVEHCMGEPVNTTIGKKSLHDEVLRLREIYPLGFYLIGVYEDEKRRYHYLTDGKRIENTDASKLMDTPAVSCSSPYPKITK